MADPLLILASTVVTLVAVPGMVLYAGGSWRMLARDAVLLAVLWALLAGLCALLGILTAGFAAPVGAMGIAVGSGVAAVLAERLGRVVRELVIAAFSLLVFFPLALVVFGGNGTWLYRVPGALDFGGALAVAVGAGTFLAVFAVVERGGHARDAGFSLRGALIVAIAAVGCAVGLELQVDALTPAIALNMLLTPAMAILAAAGIERVKWRRNSREGLAVGTLAGMVAALAACAYIETVPAVILGLLAGSVSVASFRSRSTAWRLATPLLVGGVIGLLSLGLFAEDVGFVYSGQIELLTRQALVVGASLVFAAVVSTAIVFPVRRRMRRELA